MSESMHEEAHTGPIKTPKQLLLAVFFSFVIPVFAIIGLVAYVVADNKPAGSREAESHALGGVTAQDLDRGVAARIRKVGAVEIRDANRPLKSGEEVFKAQCTTCHTPGAAGAPKVGDAAAWAARISSGFDALVQSALKGKGAMPAQSGGDFDDIEIARAAAYMANTAGAKFAEPQRPAAAPATAAAPAAATVQTAAAAPAVAAAAAPAAAAPQTAAAGAAASGEALYKQACAVCHATGAANAPKLGDKAAWAPRVQQGVPALVQNAIDGQGRYAAQGRLHRVRIRDSRRRGIHGRAASSSESSAAARPGCRRSRSAAAIRRHSFPRAPRALARWRRPLAPRRACGSARTPGQSPGTAVPARPARRVGAGPAARCAPPRCFPRLSARPRAWPPVRRRPAAGRSGRTIGPARRTRSCAG